MSHTEFSTWKISLMFQRLSWGHVKLIDQKTHCPFQNTSLNLHSLKEKTVAEIQL